MKDRPRILIIYVSYVQFSVFKAYSQASWDEFEPGHYEFPFALKVL